MKVTHPLFNFFSYRIVFALQILLGKKSDPKWIMSYGLMGSASSYWLKEDLLTSVVLVCLHLLYQLLPQLKWVSWSCLVSSLTVGIFSKSLKISFSTGSCLDRTLQCSTWALQVRCLLVAQKDGWAKPSFSVEVAKSKVDNVVFSENL